MSGTDTARFAGMDEATRQRLGRLLRARRHKLALTVKEAATAAGISDTTWSALEAGAIVRERSARRAFVGLRWPDDGYDRFVAGEDPATLPDVETPSDDLSARVAALEVTQRLLLEALGRLEDEVSRREGE